MHQNQSQIALARDAVENKRVELIAHMSSFIVQSHNKKTYSDLFCCCSSPYVKGLGPWIICDICKQWYLQKCEGMDNTKMKTNQMYICKICSVGI